MQSISFDRAADFYDQTRGYPPGVSDRIASATCALLSPGAVILEIGIGTGRISCPLAARGLQVSGIDLSKRMMQRLVAALPGGAARPDLVQADAAFLPRAPGAFEAVLAVHVFHLIAGWREALEEVRRVLRPGGCLLSGYDWQPPDSLITSLNNQWWEIARTYYAQAGRPGPRDFDPILARLQEMGAELDEIPVAEWTTTHRIDRYLTHLEAGIFSATWGVPPEVLRHAVQDLRLWAVEQFGSLEREFSVPRKFIWGRFRFKA